jgi:hypothetical protein
MRIERHVEVKPSTVLKEVAQRVERDPSEAWNGLCGVIDTLSWNRHHMYDDASALKAKEYLRQFGVKISRDGYWFGEPHNKTTPIRILASCFAAAVAESEGQ